MNTQTPCTDHAPDTPPLHPELAEAPPPPAATNPNPGPNRWQGWIRAVFEMAWIIGGKTVTMGGLFVCSVVVARLSTPAEFGIYAAAMSMVMLLDGLFGSPCDLAAVRFGSLHRDQPERVAGMMSAAVRIKVMLALAAGLAIVAGYRPLKSWILHDEHRPWLWVAVLACTVALMLVRSTQAYLQCQLRFSRYALFDILHGAARILTVVWLALAGVSMAQWYISAHALVAVVVFGVGLWVVRQRYFFAPWPGRSDLNEVVRYVGIVVLATLIGTISVRSDVILVAALDSHEAAGQYGAAMQVSLIVTMLALYTGLIVQPRLVNLARGRLLKQLLWRSQVFGVGAGTVIVLLGILFAPGLVATVFGPGYESGGRILQVLIFANAIDLLGGPVLLPVVVQFFPRVALFAEILSTAVFLVAAPLAILEAGPVGMAAVAVGARLIKLLFYLVIAWKGVDGLAESLERSGTAGSNTEPVS